MPAGATRAARRGAFTLMEVLLVVALLSILAVFAWPDFSQARRSEQVDEFTVRARALMAMCRAQSMNESRRYRVVFALDGTLAVYRQRDPLRAPEVFVRVEDDWAEIPAALEDVWIEAVMRLPEGPPPIRIDSESIQFTEFTDEPTAVDSLDEPVFVEFAPDGTSESVRWVIRDVLGRGRRLTFDGRLGRIEFLDVDRIDASAARRPKSEAALPAAYGE
ncbi:MAG: prepilin-type N-terminal cleavage/methylation domain-containing protein [Phycisphaerales bacterium]|nr:prepilin-type N-terminal cleavage/methylation domain-containing protein [Phycisphaerales bacterium]